jgi:hypothetical protein
MDPTLIAKEILHLAQLVYAQAKLVNVNRQQGTRVSEVTKKI